MAISEKRRKAIDGFMLGLTKREAMLRAGYSKSMAETRANVVFGDPAVQSEIQRRQNLATARNDISLDWIVQRLMKIADANFGDILDIDEEGRGRVDLNKLTPELQYALTGYTVDERKDGRGPDAKELKRIRVQLGDKLRALELLVRHLGLSKEKVPIALSMDESVVDLLHRGRTRAGIGGTDTDADDPV